MSISQEIRANIIANTHKEWVVPGIRALDIGCGNAVVSAMLADRLKIEIHGTDINDYRKRDISFTIMEGIYSLPFDDNSFDIAFLNDMLHHTEEPEKIVREASRVAPLVLVFEDSESRLLSFVDIFLNKLYDPDMPCPLNFHSKEEWISMFDLMGLSPLLKDVTTPLWYPFDHFAFRLMLKGGTGDISANDPVTDRPSRSKNEQGE